MVFGLATYPAHATIQNSLSHENYVMAELETSEGSAMTHSAMRSDVKSKFEELNKMIEPAAGETAEHAEKMHDTHHGAVDSAHDTMDAHHGEGAHGAYDAHHGDEHAAIVQDALVLQPVAQSDDRARPRPDALRVAPVAAHAADGQRRQR